MLCISTRARFLDKWHRTTLWQPVIPPMESYVQVSSVLHFANKAWHAQLMPSYLNPFLAKIAEAAEACARTWLRKYMASGHPEIIRDKDVYIFSVTKRSNKNVMDTWRSHFPANGFQTWQLVFCERGARQWVPLAAVACQSSDVIFGVTTLIRARRVPSIEKVSLAKVIGHVS